MKKRLYIAIAVAAMLWCATPGILASEYTWSRYDLRFETPDNGYVTYSSDTRFDVQWEDMALSIQLYSKDDSDEKVIKNNLMRKSLGFSMYDTKEGKMKVKGFKTYYIEGTMPDGSRAVISDLVDEKQNLVVEVTVNYLFGNREAVDDIIKSFAHGAKPKNDKEKKHKQKVQSKEDAIKQEQDRKREEENRERNRNRKTFEA